MKYCTKVIELTSNLAKSKNKALKECLKTNKDYFFLVESNCKVYDDSVYDKFIKVSQATGIEALMWGEGGPNRKLDFNDDTYIYYYSDFPTAFVMYTRNAIEKAGFFDEKMPANTWQELEHTKRIGDAGLSTPFGQFAGPKDITELELIFKKDEFRNLKQMDEALTYWAKEGGADFPIEIRDKKQQESKPVIEMI